MPTKEEISIIEQLKKAALPKAVVHDEENDQDSSLTHEDPTTEDEESPEQKKDRLKLQETQFKIDVLTAIFSNKKEDLVQLIEDPASSHFNLNTIQFEKIGICVLALKLGRMEIVEYLGNLPSKKLHLALNNNEEIELVRILNQESRRDQLVAFFNTPLAKTWKMNRSFSTHSIFDIHSALDAWLIQVLHGHYYGNKQDLAERALRKFPLASVVFMKEHLKPKDSTPHPLQKLPAIYHISSNWNDFFEHENVAKKTSDWILEQDRGTQELITKGLMARSIHLNHSKGLQKVLQYLSLPLARIMVQKESFIHCSLPYNPPLSLNKSDIPFNATLMSKFMHERETIGINRLVCDDYFKSMRIPTIAYALSRGAHDVVRVLEEIDYFKEESQFKNRAPLDLSLFSLQPHEVKHQINWAFLYLNAYCVDGKGLKKLIEQYGFDPQECFMKHSLPTYALFMDVAKTRLEDWYRKAPTLFETIHSLGMTPLEHASQIAPHYRINESKLNAKKALIEKMMLKKALPLKAPKAPLAKPKRL